MVQGEVKTSAVSATMTRMHPAMTSMRPVGFLMNTRTAPTNRMTAVTANAVAIILKGELFNKPATPRSAEKIPTIIAIAPAAIAVPPLDFTGGTPLGCPECENGV